jgi:hypothetical protein
MTKKSKELLENPGFLFFIVCPKGMMAHFFLQGALQYQNKGVGELIDGKDPFAIEFPNFFRCYSAQKTQVILLDGLRSAHALKLTGGAMVIQ